MNLKTYATKQNPLRNDVFLLYDIIQMKASTLILLVFCCALKSCVSSQTLSEKNMRNKEAIEIAYITDCIKANRSVDSLIEWKATNNNGEVESIYRSNGIVENGFSFKYKGRWAFFFIGKNTNGIFLKEIDYCRNSFQKTIFLNETLTEYEVNSQTRFRVWMSKDKLSVYFCMINSDNTKIWVLTNGNTVYTSTQPR